MEDFFQFESNLVKPGMFVDFVINPKAPFIGQKLVIYDGLVNFSVNNIVCDGIEQLVLVFPFWKRLLIKMRLLKKPVTKIPAVCFSPESIGNMLFLPAQKIIQIRVCNESLISANIKGKLFGKMSDKRPS